MWFPGRLFSRAKGGIGKAVLSGTSLRCAYARTDTRMQALLVSSTVDIEKLQA